MPKPIHALFFCLSLLPRTVLAQTVQEPAAPTPELQPRPVEAKPIDTKGGQATQFVADPVGDGAVLAISIGVVSVLELIQSTGEIRPQQPASNVKLLWIDKLAINQTPSSTWGTVSNLGLIGAGIFAAVDPILSGRRDGLSAGFVDAVMYAEAIALTAGMTDIAKMAIRRPRPSAYVEQARLDVVYAGRTDRPSITDTNSALSFFSGHAAIVATVGATATYLAFARSPGKTRPWITLGVATLLTGLTSYARVRAGKHFPTDVIAGSLAGAGIGSLVPHLHRSDSAKSRPVWIGFAPSQLGRGGELTAAAAF
jgi:undecaprenyl-diphosphatase